MRGFQYAMVTEGTVDWSFVNDEMARSDEEIFER